MTFGILTRVGECGLRRNEMRTLCEVGNKTREMEIEDEVEV